MQNASSNETLTHTSNLADILGSSESSSDVGKKVSSQSSVEDMRSKEFEDILSNKYDSKTAEQADNNPVPEEFWDKEKNAIKAEELLKRYQELEKSNKGLRNKLSRNDHTSPDSVDKYVVDLTEEEEAEIGDLVRDTKDPMLSRLKEVCFDNKISNHTYSTIVKEMTAYLKQNAEAIANGEHLSPEEIKEYQEQEIKKIGPNGKAVQRAVIDMCHGLYKTHKIDENDVRYIEKHFGNAEGINFLNKIRFMLSEKDAVPVNIKADDGLPSDEDIKKMLLDDRFRNGNREYQEQVESVMKAREKAGRGEFKTSYY